MTYLIAYTEAAAAARTMLPAKAGALVRAIVMAGVITPAAVANSGAARRLQGTKRVNPAETQEV